jgi:hypothetical protein
MDATRLMAGALGVGALITLTSADGGVNRLGAMGDSLTDEYWEEIAVYARNWFELLVDQRGLDAGPTAAEAGEPGGTWGEPRRAGYKHDWARSGADTNTLISGGQHTGLAAQVVPDGVGHVVLAIGSNDFNPTTLAYFSIYNGLWSAAQIESHVTNAVANIETALSTVQAAGADVALVNVLDFGVVPAVWGNFLYGNASKRENVAVVIRDLNHRLVDVARDYGVVYVDAYGMAHDIFGDHAALNTTLLLGNVSIDLTASDTTDNTNPTAGFVDDGAHPHTHLQGLFANIIARGLDAGYDAEIAPFTESELLEHAGIAYGGADTLPGQVEPPAAYVFNFALPGDLTSDGVVGVDDFLALLAQWGSCPAPPGACPADLDGDGEVGVNEFLTLLANWSEL